MDPSFSKIRILKFRKNDIIVTQIRHISDLHKKEKCIVLNLV